MVNIDINSTTADITKAGGKSIEVGSGLDQQSKVLFSWVGHSVDVFFLTGYGCQMCKAGIILDQVQLARISNFAGLPVKINIAPYVALAHEMMHYDQLLDHGSLPKFVAAYNLNSLLFELEADYIAGAFIGIQILKVDHDFTQLHDLATAIGSSDWLNGSHPGPDQRTSAIYAGLTTAAYWANQDIELPFNDAKQLANQFANRLLNGGRPGIRRV